MPLIVAVVAVSKVGAAVTIVGADSVVNDSTAPKDSPSLFDAIAQ